MVAIKRLLPIGKRDTDMTEGSTVRHLISFALPLLIGNVFQQLYNTVDTWVVGNYVSNEAFSAVGTVGPIITVLIGFFTGLSSGASAVISQYYGAKQQDKVREAVHSTILMTLALGVIFTAVGILMTPTMLMFTKTPEEVFPLSRQYLTIYFAGVLGLMIYNIGSGIMRAVGDSTRPFLFLLLSALLNTVLDLLFVLGFGMGVEGVAYATILSQGISALLVVIVLMRSHSCIRLSLRDLKMNWQVLGKIIDIGFPAAIQISITSFSNVFVQSYINYFGADCMSGWTAYSKVDQLILLPMQSLALASTTFVGQNLGSGQEARAKRGVRIALLLSTSVTILIIIPIMVFAPWLVGFFNGKAEVIECGSLFLRYLSPFYVFSCINQIYVGALRGAGNGRVPMIISVFSFVVFRQIYLFIMANYIANEMLPIAMSFPTGWMLCSALVMIYFHRTKLSRSRVVD